ncbi:MAG: methionine--tRNA ligase [Candidatus Sungiibacteriota bacterium]
MIEKKSKKFYITTAIPYVNDRPHVGHALEFVQADVLARAARARGEDVLVLSGADENALKNVQAAEKAGVPVEAFIETNAKLFATLAELLNVHFDMFQRGSDTRHHYPASQELWRRCADAGDIYKKSYEGLYCLGCEAFYTAEELTIEGECAEHPGRKLEMVSEENYFFRLSKYRDALIDLISSDTVHIIPATRKNEVLGFLRTPLQDISISRSNARARNWGVPVPGDDTQRMYVWFDALNIYQSGVGFEWDEEMYQKWWPADAHLIGKGILRFHAVYWPAFLLAAKLPLPKSIIVHGYITVDGQKMSKTIGNGVDPFELIEKYGTDPVRYYLLREIPSGEDGDFSYEKFKQRYNGDLANGIGNLVARVAKLGERGSPISIAVDVAITEEIARVRAAVAARTEEFRLNEALASIWELVSFADKYINDTKPWTIKDDPAALQKIVANVAVLVNAVRELLMSFLPDTAENISKQITVSNGAITIKKGENLFPRLK